MLWPCIKPDSPPIRRRGDINEDSIMEEVKFPLRMSEELRERLKAEAKRSVRSLNGEIVFRLRQSVEAQQFDEGARS
jgi:predicted HicB family RNase H-like nuclease